MDKFKTLKSIPAVLTITNVDTDMIIPKQFLKTIKKTGLGKSLFYDLRFDENNKKTGNFILDQEPFNNSKILISGKNFGCGSSREHAPWALLDFGIRSIIAPSFADIFYNNCFKNGILPIALDQNQIEEIKEYSSQKKEIEINLVDQKIKFGNQQIQFKIEEFKKKCLIEGLDDVALSLKKSNQIEAYENKIKNSKPWIN